MEASYDYLTSIPFAAAFEVSKTVWTICPIRMYAVGHAPKQEIHTLLDTVPKQSQQLHTEQRHTRSFKAS
jgi:hypothetical protein